MSSPLAVETKMPLVMSPSMPSQLSSLKVPSGTSLVAGGAQPPQPLSPMQVRVPPQAPKGVVMLHALVLPVSAAVQSHAPEVGTHCLEVPMSPPSVTSLHSYCAGQPVLAQSAPQKLPPVE